MFVTIVSDCNSQNDFGRQATRIFRLFGTVPVKTVGIEFGGTLEASGNLVDMVDCSEGEEGIIMVNAAPRHGQAKKWPNGTPFGYFYHKNTLIIATIDGYTLSLAKKFGILEEIHVTDVPLVIETMIKQKKLRSELKDLIVDSQFRSFDYMPRLAKWLKEGIEIPHEVQSINSIPEVPHAVWLVDGFGNCKTTILPEEINHTPGKILKTKIGNLKCYGHLKDVSNNQPGLIVGSSGYGLNRFLEIVIQGKSAAQHFNLKSGSIIM